MNNLNTLLLVYQQVNMLKGGQLSLLKCNNIMEAANIVIYTYMVFLIKS